MKKALAIISAVALVGVAAFAEDAPALKLSGYVDTGIKAVTTDDKTAQDTVQLWGDDSGTTTRFDLNGTYTNGNAGVDFKLRTEALGAPAINHFEAWTLLADGKVKLVAGKLDTSSWKTEGDDGFTSENNEGIQVQILPVSGLNVGVKFNTNGASTYKGKDFFQELGFGGKYTADLFNFAAGYKLDSKGDIDTGNYAVKAALATVADTAVKAGATDKGAAAVAAATALMQDDIGGKEAYAYAGINYKGITNLKLIAEAKWMNLGKYSDMGLAEYDEIIEYKVSDPLSAGILMYQYMPGKSDYKTKLSFKPYASYVVSSLVKGTGEFGYVINDSYAKDKSTFWVKPGVELTVSPNSKILINDSYKIEDMNKKAGDKITSNTFNVNFRFNF